jgi:hypothetical protein
MVRSICLAVLLFAQTYPASAWDGTWTWGTYQERIAYGEQVIAESATIAREHCGQPYFGTICS